MFEERARRSAVQGKSRMRARTPCLLRVSQQQLWPRRGRLGAALALAAGLHMLGQQQHACACGHQDQQAGVACHSCSALRQACC